MRKFLALLAGVSLVVPASVGLVFTAPAVSQAHGHPERGHITKEPAPVERVGRVDLRTFPGVPRRHKGLATASEFGNWLHRDEKESGVRSTTSLAPPSPGNRPVDVRQNRLGWEGLDQADQRLAGGGNQFSVEPPDQGLCVGGVNPDDPGFGPEVVESVNDAVTVYDSKGNQLAPVFTLDEFYGLPPTINRTTGEYGPFLTDPKCYFDVDTQRWFHSVSVISQDPKTGDLEAPSFVYFAVSTSAEALGPYNIYRIDTTDPAHADCPCFGDQPLIGADKYGFYISTAEYPIVGDGFNGPQIYAFDKSALTAGSLGPVVHLSGITHVAGGRTTGTVQPAMSPDAVFETAHNGTEYFLSSFDCLPVANCPIAPGQFDKITVWALTGTRSLGTANPNLTLSLKDIDSEVWGTPVPQRQKPGPRPLGELVGEPLPLVEANDSRMNQVVFADGMLWSALNTVVAQRRDGIAYFIVDPSVSDGQVRGTIHNQGYVASADTYLSFPAVGVNGEGKGVIAMSLMGPEMFPSAAQIQINKSGVKGKVEVVGLGYRPEDGFTCYEAFIGEETECRWGDYSASVGTPDGAVYSATEFIGNNARTESANWSTFVWPTGSSRSH